MSDEYGLERFLDAQAGIYHEAIALLRGGTMCTLYMDIIFPRLARCHPEGAANLHVISSLDEARAYLANPVLGDRYRECIDALTWRGDMAAADVFGEPDTKKLHSSLTLFSEATNEPLLRTMLAVWFDNMVDEQTIIQLDLVA